MSYFQGTDKGVYFSKTHLVCVPRSNMLQEINYSKNAKSHNVHKMPV